MDKNGYTEKYFCTEDIIPAWVDAISSQNNRML
jgi:hypothetical protein